MRDWVLNTRTMQEQTWLELDLNAGVVLNLLDHLAVPANHNPHGEARHGNLKAKRTRVEL